MTSKPINGLSQALEKKRSIFQLAMIAIGVAFSVGNLSSLLVSADGVSKAVVAISSSLILVAVMAFIAWEWLRQLTFKDEYRALLLVSRNSNKPIMIRNYKFSEEFARTLTAIEAENKAIYSDWVKNPVCRPRREKDGEEGGDETEAEGETDGKGKQTLIAITRHEVTGDEDEHGCSSLIEEIAMFMMLDMLSTHLEDYFNKIGGGDVVELRREHIPDYILQNRVLNLLSTPIEQRAIFADAFPDPDKRPTGEIMSLWSSDGAVFSRFDLKLPRGSRVRSLGDNIIEIRTNRITLRVKVRFKTFSSFVQPAFLQMYVGAKPDDVDSVSVMFELQAKISPFAMLRGKGWEYYSWLDDFRSKISRNLDFRTFQTSLHWDVIEPLLFSLRSRAAMDPAAAMLKRKRAVVAKGSDAVN